MSIPSSIALRGRSREWELEIGALHVSDETLRVSTAAFDSAKTSDLLLNA